MVLVGIMVVLELSKMPHSEGLNQVGLVSMVGWGFIPPMMMKMLTLQMSL